MGFLKAAAWTIGSVAMVAVVGLGVATNRAQARLDRTWDIPVDPLPVPWPGSTLDEAVSRGEHLVTTRLGCPECHGADAAGGVIVDAFPMGRWVAPNLTTGEGGRGASLTNDDWVRAVRHGVTSDGTTSTMPAVDYTGLSDRELSDVVAYMRSRPPVDRVQPAEELGPLRAVLFLAGAIPISAEHIDHAARRPAEPPEATVSATFGAHVAGACVGCHGPTFAGGPIPGGDPAWPEAADLRLHGGDIDGWTEDDFLRAMRTGKRPDGTELRAPMPWQATRGMTDTELLAVYAYLESLPGEQGALSRRDDAPGR